MFLEPLLAADGTPCILVNCRTGVAIAEAVEPALDSVSRRRGLLGRERLAAGCALIIAPSSAIHTFGMRFAIDVAFATRSGRLLKLCHSVPPRRIRAGLRGFAAIELPAGTLGRTGCQAGDRVELRRRPSASGREP